MKIIKYAALVLLMCPLFAFAQTPKDTGLAFLDKLFQNQYATCIQYFDESVKPQLTEALLQQTVAAITQKIGSYKSNIGINEETGGPYRTIYYYSRFEKQDLDIKVTFSKSDKIMGFFLVPHQEADKKKS